MVQRIATLPWDRTQRRLDVLLVLLAAPFWLPTLGLLLLLKRIFDGGPVLFGQVRMGRYGKPFVLYKIRTTPSDFHPRPDDWPDEHYPPRTPLGRLLRRMDLDELPQLWNVLRGEMSLVGPRPETPYHSKKFLRCYPAYAWRWQVRPGLTGLAQARGWRGDTSIEQRLASDLEYVCGRRAGLYHGILLRTIASELRRLRR
ncbi:MAG TPA: sugar transferase [Bryobacteraceae bacterium]|nr:sugar transferase [Bryobacteraceae bacterium]